MDRAARVAAVLPPEKKVFTADSIFGPVDYAQEWLDEFAAAITWGELSLVSAARGWVKYQYEVEYIENDAFKFATRFQWRAFWDCYEIVTGEAVPEEATHVDRDGLPFTRIYDEDDCAC